jgi:lipopolysaccharide/colanic/teichoic acid biosynthesis glycosyltransferase
MPPTDKPARTTQTLPVIEQVSTAWHTRLAALTRPPKLLPQNGTLIFQAEGVSKVSDPDFWVNRYPYQSGSARMIYSKLKRLMDLVLIVLSLPVVLPVGGLLALLLVLDSGRPIFFVQMRTGLGGRRFKMYKFRSMVPNAEQMLKDLAAQGFARLNGDGKLAEPLKMEHDPRVTRLGRILRKTSLDELPQVFNVLRGDMSLVGPRPTSWNVDSYTLLQTERLSVRPGITGLWQVCSRGTTDFNTWLEWDVRYIEKMSFGLDMQILIRTVSKVLSRSGAH